MNSYLKKLSPYMVLKGIRYLRHFGWKEFWIRLSERMEPEEVPYGPWYEAYVPDEAMLAKQRARVWKHPILFSLIVPCFHTPGEYLREMLDSVFSQTYPHFELIVVNASPQDPAMREILHGYEADPRLLCISLDENKGISGNTNAGLARAKGDFVCFLDHDDTLSPAALFLLARYLEEHPKARMVYTDEDKITSDGKEHFQPHLKPDFNLDLLRSNNYICHFLSVERTLAQRAGGLRDAFNGAQDYDFIFRCAELAAAQESEASEQGSIKTAPGQERTGEAAPMRGKSGNGLSLRMTGEVIGHVPEILYHWRVHAASTADNPESKRYAYEAGKRAIEEHLQRCGQEGTVELLKDHGFYRVHYPVPESMQEDRPLVSVIIPNKDEREALRVCVESLSATTQEISKEILIVENNSTQEETFRYYRELSEREDIRLLRWKKPFNYSAINNFAASRARGRYLLFLNNDTRAIDPGWLSEMLGVCRREDVGAVGIRLQYPEGTIQHAGIVVGLGGVAGSLFVDMKAERSGYLHKASLLQDLSAVTAACMLVPREVFERVNGFEEKLSVAFNDVDLCLRIGQSGLRIVYDPFAVLIHDESRTRGAEDSKEKVRRFQDEIEQMRTRWEDLLKEGDPCYNKNLSLSKWNYALRAGAKMESGT